ncbi:Dystrophin-like protein 1, partial [Stegodyphus mimosarum]
MLRAGSRNSVPQEKPEKNFQQQQKQKKRLSFKDPEIEGPQQSTIYGGCRSKILTGRISERRPSTSVEDLTLEDQALQIVQSVGSAFSDFTLQEREPSNCFDSIHSSTSERTNRDYSPTEESYQKASQLQSFKISPEDREYLDTRGSPVFDLTMRGPSNESNERNFSPNCIPTTEVEEKYPSSAQHQIQLLKYHLDQQCQQTQMALHQVQLLTDQMAAESAARHKVQEQNNHLMAQNKELLDHIERLFQQIEDLEKQIHFLEERKGMHFQDIQAIQTRQTTSFSGNRRLTSEQAAPEKTATTSRIQYPTTRRSSLTPTKPVSQSRTLTSQSTSLNQTTSNRKSSLISQRPYTTTQNKTSDINSKPKEMLRIGDVSPPIQSGTTNPLADGWRRKSHDQNTQSTTEKTTSISARNRTGSFSSFSKLKPPESSSGSSSSLFNSSSNISKISETANKKHSSSTSDLYKSSTNIQANKPLVIDESPSSGKSDISNANVNFTSKLPRFQPYNGWQRRSSLSNDFDQISALGKDIYKKIPETSLFNR